MTGTMLIVRILNAVWGVAVVAYVAYGWYAYVGVYRVFAEWQISVFGSYRVLLTALLPILVLLLPLLPGAIWLQRRGGTGWSTPPDPRRTARWLAIAGIVALLVAAVAGALGYRATSKEPITAAFDLRRTTTLPAADRFVVTGVARTDLMLRFETESRGQTRSYAYVPLTPPDWQRGQPLAYFLKTNQTAYLPTGGGRPLPLAHGQTPFVMTTQPAIIESHALPGPLREAYRTNNLTLARDIRVFSQNISEALEHYWVTAGVGGLTGIICLIIAAIGARRPRRTGA